MALLKSDYNKYALLQIKFYHKVIIVSSKQVFKLQLTFDFSTLPLKVKQF